jgi:hypothetical protein
MVRGQFGRGREKALGGERESEKEMERKLSSAKRIHMSA